MGYCSTTAKLCVSGRVRNHATSGILQTANILAFIIHLHMQAYSHQQIGSLFILIYDLLFLVNTNSVASSP